MGELTKIDLKIQKASNNSLCIGTGFVAMDIVEGKEKILAAVGGSCGNVMAILSHLGWDARPVARLGLDHAGSFVRTQFEKIGVDVRYLSSVPNVQTPIVIQHFFKGFDGERTHKFSLRCPDCGTWLPRYRATTLLHASTVIDKSRLPQAFYFDRVSPSALKLAGWVRKGGGLVVFEPSSIGDERQFEKAVDAAHILKYSHDRLGDTLDSANIADLKTVIETHGADGLRVRWRAHWRSFQAIVARQFVDAAGSGDWCTAGIIHALGQSKTSDSGFFTKDQLDHALRLGQALAAINCEFEGARGAMYKLDIDSLNLLLNDSSQDVPVLCEIDMASNTIPFTKPCIACSQTCTQIEAVSVI